jgi:hypothetical protein
VTTGAAESVENDQRAARSVHRRGLIGLLTAPCDTTQKGGTCQRKRDTGCSLSSDGDGHLLGPVDPEGIGDPGCLGRGPEPVGSCCAGGVEDALAFLPDDLSQAEVDVGGGVESDARVPVFIVVVLEEPFAECPGRRDVGEALRKGGRILERLELGLRVGVVVGLVRARVALEDSARRAFAEPRPANPPRTCSDWQARSADPQTLWA